MNNVSIFRTLAHSESKAYSEYSQTSVMKTFIQNILKALHIQIVVYSHLWYILKSKHIQNPAKYLRWNILLKTLCNCSKFRCLIYSQLPDIQNSSVSAAPEFMSYLSELLTVSTILS